VVRICGLPWVSGLPMEEVEVCFYEENWESWGKKGKKRDGEERENNNILIK
jgi:hypothetical protein